MDNNTKILIGIVACVVICLICLCCSSSLGLFTPKPAKICTPGAIEECACAGGKKGKRTCNTDGSAFSSCGNCQDVPICTPGAEKVCDAKCPNGSSQVQICNVDGLSYSSCNCKGTTCVPGQQKPCNCQDGSAGSQICNSDGSGYDNCKCEPAKKCIAGQTKDCPCPNGITGKQTCKSDGSDFGTCECPAGVSKLYGVNIEPPNLMYKTSPNSDWTTVQSYRVGEPEIRSFDQVGNKFVGTFTMPQNSPPGFITKRYVYTKSDINGAWNGPKETQFNPKKFLVGPDNEYYSINISDGCVYNSKCFSGPWSRVDGMCELRDLIVDSDRKGFVGVKYDGKLYTKASKNPSDAWVKTSDDCCVTSIAYANNTYYGIGTNPRAQAIYTKKTLTDRWSDVPIDGGKGIGYISSTIEKA
ncbi:MAG: hypothetical protein Edafosvirus1_95 [Edafosvirus sp.]|uniref:Uncharacterized protein n=1 Tax=Edafosvirus sp. TaxID=2487765 RepID=A0A3G4ZTX6_9VIRU|nr:MAG: hypothetical protein Edafosvirus1_95 [Edafosvirus sp.]